MGYRKWQTKENSLKNKKIIIQQVIIYSPRVIHDEY